jgi:hypothetical protein
MKDNLFGIPDSFLQFMRCFSFEYLGVVDDKYSKHARKRNKNDF